jgi:hypothetical protein
MDTYKDISELTNDDIRGLEFCFKKKRIGIWFRGTSYTIL